ncbi:hypothetical protein QCA50_013262 [Cerrena zonata]|uniref:Uncharacterized protein n=1 Tax=Cerrena zonata TaxID=2478898 RepID=A0AAW0G1C1_9APHY
MRHAWCLVAVSPAHYHFLHPPGFDSHLYPGCISIYSYVLLMSLLVRFYCTSLQISPATDRIVNYMTTVGINMVAHSSYGTRTLPLRRLYHQPSPVPDLHLTQPSSPHSLSSCLETLIVLNTQLASMAILVLFRTVLLVEMR